MYINIPKKAKYAEIYEKVHSYYKEKFEKFGCTAKGVDWGNEEAQRISFEQLVKILPDNKKVSFSLLDYGAGYGALYPYVKKLYKNCIYTGFDINEKAIASANKEFPEAEWISEPPENREFDYVISCGIFSVRPGIPYILWEAYIEYELEKMNKMAKKGFAFNMLTKYSDPLKVKDYLYYADPCYYFHLCKTKYGKRVLLNHAYPRYEFTIMVNKEEIA